MPRSTTRQQPGPGPANGAEADSWTREVRTLARTVEASGVMFAALFVVALVLVRQAPGIAVPDRVYAQFYTVGQGNLVSSGVLWVCMLFAGTAAGVLLVGGVLLVQASRRRAADAAPPRPAQARPSADGSPLPAQRSPDEHHDQP